MSKKIVFVRIFDALIAIIILATFLIGITTSDINFIVNLTILILSSITLYLNIYRPHYLFKPELDWEPNSQISPPTQSEAENDGAGISWFLRLKIVNKGLTPAKNCVGRLIEVRDNNNKQLDRFDPFTLYWARQNNLNPFSPIDIQGNGDFFFLDIAQIKEADKDHNPIDLRIVTSKGRLVSDSNVGENSKLPSGIYHLCIAVYAEGDVYIKPNWVTIVCDTNFSVDSPPTIDF